MNINRVIMTGRIASIREGRTAKGTFVANIRIANNDEGNKATFWNIAIWGALGEKLFQYLRVGERFAADGRMMQDASGGAFISIGRSGMVELLSSKIEAEHIANKRAAKEAAKADAPKSANKKDPAFEGLNSDPDPFGEIPPAGDYEDSPI